jgi:hypothetical protein
MNTELEARRDLLQRRLGALAAGKAVGDDADVMAAVGLCVGEIQDVAKDSADRCAHRVQDSKRLVCNNGHVQNRRAPARTLSHAPGAAPRMQPDGTGAS